jgi:hypothetical protein
MTEKKRQGLAALDVETRRRIASQGGKAAHKKGAIHTFTSEEAREAGRKGGLIVSQDREHMARIGRKGGQVTSRDRKHMGEIGRKGGGKHSNHTPSVTDETSDPPSPETSE